MAIGLVDLPDRQAQEPLELDLGEGGAWLVVGGPRSGRTTALRTIATKLGREDGFVLFHIDGDRTWTDRATSENEAKFDKIVVARVRQLLQGRPGSTAEDAEARLSRLFPVMPFYSIEAWLYQHTAVAIRLCCEKYNGRDVGKFEE